MSNIKNIANKIIKSTTALAMPLMLAAVVLPSSALAAKSPVTTTVPPVTKGHVSIYVSDANTANPLAGALVTVTGSSNPAPVAHGNTGVTGYFNSTLPEGTYSLRVEMDNYLPTDSELVVNATAATTSKISLRPNTVLQPEGQITLFVADASSKAPLAEAEVRVYAGTNSQVYTKGATDGAGMLTFDLQPGVYHMNVTRNGYNSYSTFIEIQSASHVTVEAILTDAADVPPTSVKPISPRSR